MYTVYTYTKLHTHPISKDVSEEWFNITVIPVKEANMEEENHLKKYFAFSSLVAKLSNESKGHYSTYLVDMISWINNFDKRKKSAINPLQVDKQ